jgi:hypothetical protein
MELIDVARLERRVSSLEKALTNAQRECETLHIRADAQLSRIMELENLNMQHEAELIPLRILGSSQ